MRYLTLFILLLLFWLLLTFELSPENIITGAVAAIVATLFFGKFFVKGVRKFFQPARYFWMIVYLFIFIWECLKANFDVAYRVLHPAMPIKPGIVKVKLNLESHIGRTFLAMSITMTPGTIAVDIIDDHIYIHWIFISNTDPEVYGKKISGRFEKHLKRIFE
jgi:multicomponent Na+:H+ antiporter subunit E